MSFLVDAFWKTLNQIGFQGKKETYASYLILKLSRCGMDIS